MDEISFSKVMLFGIALFAGLTRPVSAAPPSACRFLTPAAVSAAIGKPVMGGTTSGVDHAGATASSCLYMAGPIAVVLLVDDRGSAGAAMEEYRTQLGDSQAKDKDTKGNPDEQKTVLESGLGDGAYSDDATNGSVRELTAVRGSLLFKLGIMGGASVPKEQMHGLMRAAVSATR